jgi:N utilization substance protein B
MVSRRNIRVKVMQTLYSLEAMDNQLPPAGTVTILKKNLEQSKQLFTYLVNFIIEIARYAETDALQKLSKHLPTQSDLNINTKIAENEFVLMVLGDKSFNTALNSFKLLPDDELVRKLYHELITTPQYQSYISIPAREKISEKNILQFIFSDIMLPNENFIYHIEEYFINWDDDGDMMITLMTAFFQKPGSFNFNEIITNEKWEFAKELLQCVNDKKEYCLELIKPRLKNWDSERIAALDMIIMQMGLCEFLYFETIPPKVTINEYIDLAKEYSTPQSGHFVNGILDTIHKELISANKIHKKNFRNSTL